MARIVNPLDDILEIKNSKTLFPKYYDREIVLEKILNEFVSGKYSNGTDTAFPRGFYTNENNEDKVGIITHCQTISMFVNLMGKAENIKTIEPYFDDAFYSFNEIVKSLKYKDAPKLKDIKLVYNASPYLDDSSDRKFKITNYVDTMAKVLIAMCDFRFLLISMNNVQLHIDNYDEKLKICENIICLVMRDLTNAAIKLETPIPYYPFNDKEKYENSFDQNKFAIKYKGWNFISFNSPNKGEPINSAEYDPSFYFTYAVGNAYINFYNYFDVNIKEMRHARDFINSVNNKGITNAKEIYKPLPLNAVDKVRFDQNKDFMERIFFEYFFEFSRCVLDAGHYVDYMMNKKIDTNAVLYIGQEFNPVTEKEIFASSTNDALFNNLFAYAILLYSGVDLDYADVGEAEKFYTNINYGLVNVERCIFRMIREKKDYIINQKLIDINEKIPQNCEYIVENAKKIRKKRIQAITIVPLLVRVHSEISKYLTQYPEKDMKTYLRYIMERRSIDFDTKKPVWVWDEEGFDLNVTLYYVQSLNDFYNYYETYEKKYYEDENRINVAIDETEHAAQKILQEKDREISQLKAELTAEKNKKEPIVQVLEQLFDSYIKENILDILTNVINKEIQENSLKKDDKYSSFYETFRKFLISYCYETLRGDTDLKISKRNLLTGEITLNQSSAEEITKAVIDKLNESIKKFAKEAYDEKKGI